MYTITLFHVFIVTATLLFLDVESRPEKIIERKTVEVANIEYNIYSIDIKFQREKDKGDILFLHGMSFISIR